MRAFQVISKVLGRTPGAALDLAMVSSAFEPQARRPG